MSAVEYLVLELKDGSTVSLQAKQQSAAGFFVQPDQYTARWRYAVRPAAPAPAVFRTGVIDDNLSFRRAIFSERWQYYALDLLCLSAYGRKYSQLSSSERDVMLQAFLSVYKGTDPGRFLTNYAGVDTHKSYPTGEIAGRDDAKIDPLICAGNVVQGVVEGSMVRLVSFDAASEPPEPALDDPRVLRATIINRDGALRDFPQLSAFGASVFYPYVTAHACYYPLSELREV